MRPIKFSFTVKQTTSVNPNSNIRHIRDNNQEQSVKDTERKTYHICHGGCHIEEKKKNDRRKRKGKKIYEREERIDRKKEKGCILEISCDMKTRQ